MTLSNFVSADIYYADLPADGARLLSYIDENGQRQTNFGASPHEVQIENVRGHEKTFSLDKNGFAFIHAPVKHKAFLNDEEIKTEYYPDVIGHIKKVTGASRVVIFDHSK